ncbi:MAG TPA: glycoside hydrolase family 97 protein [Tepidisphaeraceae bacterium]|jgi:alpha-glucosidase
MLRALQVPPRARRHFQILLPLIAVLALIHLAPEAKADNGEIQAASPSGDVAIQLRLNQNKSDPDKGALYRITYRGSVVIDNSPLNITFKGAGPLHDLELLDVRRDSQDQTYPIVAGKTSTARDHFNEVTARLRERGGGRTVEIILRAYDDGAAFRYRLPEQPGMKHVEIASEDSTFSLPAAAKGWILPIPDHTSHYEFYYQPKSLEQVETGKLIGLPLLVEFPEGGPAVAITEANLTDYAGMYLTRSNSTNAGRVLLRSDLSPHPKYKDVKVVGDAPRQTPWRVIMIAPSAAKLLESNLVYNLNDPCAIADTSWIKPGKVAFLWWNGYLVDHNGRRGGVDTATFKHYIDGAAEFGFAYSSIDGLDIAWYGGKIPGYGEHDITVPVKSLDMHEVLAHAKSKGVRIRLWVASAGLRKYLDKALATYEQWGVEGIMVDFIQRDDQEMINWIREMVAKAAQHKLTVTLHNVSKPTGLSRTYPNLLTHEAVLNQEWNKWSPGSTPEHQLTVPFTRMLAGPLDFHQGGFRSVRASDFLPRDIAPDVMGTRCHQLAMYVVYDNPMPMAVDYPAAYRGRRGIDFLSDVPTTWDETRVIQGRVSDYITIARRKGKTWYVGSMTDDDARELKIPLAFLGEGKFVAEIWNDDASAGPNGVKRERRQVRREDALTAAMVSAGGQVVRIACIDEILTR